MTLPKTLTQQMTQTYLQRLIQLAGARRFRAIAQIYAQLDTPNKELLFRYYRQQSNVFEPVKFDNRLQAKGFYKYSVDAVEKYMDEFVTVMQSAKEHKLF